MVRAVSSSEKPGAALVEVIVAAGVCALVLVALSRMTVGAFTSSSRATDYAEATALANGGLEAARSIAGRNWSLMVNGTHGVSVNGTHYVFNGSSDTFGPYTRAVTIADGRRSGDDLVESGGSVDPDTKRVTSVVSWLPDGSTQSVSVTLVSYVMNWRAYSSAASSLYSYGSSTPIVTSSAATSAFATSAATSAGATSAFATSAAATSAGFSMFSTSAFTTSAGFSMFSTSAGASSAGFSAISTSASLISQGQSVGTCSSGMSLPGPGVHCDSVSD